MQVSYDEGVLFYKLYAALLSFVNETLKVVPERLDSREYSSLPPKTRLAVRDAFFEHRELLDQFLQKDPAGLSADELAIVAGWKHAVVGQFYVFRYLASYTVFLTSGSNPNKAYGVLALADSFEDVIGPYLPRLVHAVLLPFQGQIIYDGLLSGHNITFGGGVKRMLNEEYRRAKETFGIITFLPEGTTAKSKRPKKVAGSTQAKDILNVIVQMTDAFCKEHLNEEYAEVCRKLAGVLARKRPSPLLRGKPETWASGIVRTIGRVNFLDDPSQTPHLRLPMIDQAFGVAESTGQGKSQLIRKMLKIHQFDPQWTLLSRLDDNHFLWMLEVNGFSMDIRHAPREAQVVAYEKGLIPYIPADREETR